MFEESETAARSLIDRICGSSRIENRAAAQKLVSIRDLYLLRQREFGDCAAWSTDTTEAVTAEVAAALRISQGLAASHLCYARAMREKLPQVATVFVAGDIDYLMYQTLVYRTALITDAEVLTSVDAELAVKVPRWPSLSRGGSRVGWMASWPVMIATRCGGARNGPPTARWTSGTAAPGWPDPRLPGCTDGRALDKRLDALAASVCDADPRTRVQRRADAMGALAAGAERLACECGRPDCPAGGKRQALWSFM